MNNPSLEAGLFRKHLILDHGWDQDRAWADGNLDDHAASHPDCMVARDPSRAQGHGGA